MDILLFVFCFAIFSYLLLRIKFVTQIGIKPWGIFLLFIVKIIAALAIGWINNKYYPLNDYWGLNKEGFIEYKLLISNPLAYFKDITTSHYADQYGNFFRTVDSYWNDLRTNIGIKLLAISNIIARGNYYINSLIFNFFGFLGYIALFKVFIHSYPLKKKAVIFGCFLLPSTLFFTSGLNKDLFIFTLLAFYSYALYFILNDRYTIKRLLLLLLSAVFILLIRNFLFVAIIPSTIGLIISSNRKFHPAIAFFGIYFLACMTLLFIDINCTDFQPLGIISQRQNDFLQLPEAGSQLSMGLLQPTLKSFILNLPNAINHGFLRPFIWDEGNIFMLLLSIELFFYQGLLLFMFFCKETYHKKTNPIIWFGLSIAIFMWLIIGFVIPNIGAIVRYKSLFLPFLIIPILCNISTEKFDRIKRII